MQKFDLIAIGSGSGLDAANAAVGHAPSHGIKEITPDLATKVKSKIKDQ